jgi:hypothetical protein
MPAAVEEIAYTDLEPSVTTKTIEFIDVNKLLLDRDNPRLPEDLSPRTQEKMIEYIASKGAIEDLMSSIGKNGFFVGEALVAYKNPADKQGHLRVIEGNRRLTAVKLILKPSLYPERPSVKELATSAKNKDQLTELPVVIFPSREEVLPYLGSRHIVGVRQWEPLAKARYMRQLFNVLHKKGQAPREGYRAVAEQIGSYKRSDYIKSNLDGLAVYEVIDKKNFFGIDNLSEETIDFGTLYTAVGYEQIAEYIGAAKFDTKSKTYQRLEPINSPDVLKPEKIKRLTQWLYKENEDGETVVGESRKLPMLAKVLASAEARKQLETGATLDIAYGYTTGINDDLMEHLQGAKKYLRAANGLAPSCQPSSALTKVAEELGELSDNLIATLSRKASRSPARR